MPPNHDRPRRSRHMRAGIDLRPPLSFRRLRRSLLLWSHPTHTRSVANRHDASRFPQARRFSGLEFLRKRLAQPSPDRQIYSQGSDAPAASELHIGHFASLGGGFFPTDLFFQPLQNNTTDQSLPADRRLSSTIPDTRTATYLDATRYFRLVRPQIRKTAKSPRGCRAAPKVGIGECRGPSWFDVGSQTLVTALSEQIVLIRRSSLRSVIG